MKLQCSCGAKYTFEVSPEMAREPVHFVCSACGLDSSEYVTQLVRQQLGVNQPAIAPPPTSIAPPPPSIAPPPPSARNLPPPVPSIAPPPAKIGAMAQSPSIPPPAPDIAPPPREVTPRPANATATRPRIRIPNAAGPLPQTLPEPVSNDAPGSVASAPAGLRIHREAPAAHTQEVAEDDPEQPARCLKHGGELAVGNCYVCQKPICPKCMELFGYVCSPLCKAKADSHGIDIPVFEGQKSVVEARNWRRVVWISSVLGGAVAAFLAVWFWYEWWGCQPRTMFSIRFPDAKFSGQSAFAGKDQLVFLHGGTLARYNMKDRHEIWSRYLVDTNALDREMDADLKEMQKRVDKANQDDPDFAPKMPDPVRLRRSMLKGAEAALHLRLTGQNIWVMGNGKLTRYDWDSGKPVQDIPLQNSFGGMIRRGDELLVLDESGDSLTRINLNTCQSSHEDIGLPKELASSGKSAARPGSTAARSGAAGLPSAAPGKDLSKPLDPRKVAEQASHLPLPARIALPATLANSMNQERTMRELQDDGTGSSQKKTGTAPQIPREMFSLVPTHDGFVQFAARMLEEHITTRSGMKPAAGEKSVLNGTLNASQSLEAANEILNEMQRDRGGDVVHEDESKYLVQLRSPDGKNEWSGEVIGAPHFYPCKSVNVVAGNKTVIVLDKNNRKLWQSSLQYNVTGSTRDFEDEDARSGQGPCVEGKDSLYVFDQGMLTAFDLSNGNARWRLPSVGISSLFLDSEGMLYINTTDAGPDNLKYSRQIDVSRKTLAVAQKIDPKNGKVLWTAFPGGPISYVLGKFIYTVQYYDPGDPEDDGPYTPDTGLETPPYLKIKLLNPKNGHEVWEHWQQRAPLDVQFENNTIRLVFRKEVQVLKFLTL